jgi:hypothetical protein
VTDALKATEWTQATLRKPIEILIVDSNPADTRITITYFDLQEGRAACTALMMGRKHFFTSGTPDISRLPTP